MSTAEEKGFTLNISGSQKAEFSVNSNENFSELKGKQAPVKRTGDPSDSSKNPLPD